MSNWAQNQLSIIKNMTLIPLSFSYLRGDLLKSWFPHCSGETILFDPHFTEKRDKKLKFILFGEFVFVKLSSEQTLHQKKYNFDTFNHYHIKRKACQKVGFLTFIKKQ